MVDEGTKTLKFLHSSAGYDKFLSLICILYSSYYFYERSKVILRVRILLSCAWSGL